MVIYIERDEAGTLLHAICRKKIYSRWIKDFCVKNTTLKLLTENSSEELLDFGIEKDFLNNADKPLTIKQY